MPIMDNLFIIESELIPIFLILKEIKTDTAGEVLKLQIITHMRTIKKQVYEIKIDRVKEFQNNKIEERFFR